MIGFPHRTDCMGNDFTLFFPSCAGKSLQHTGAEIRTAEDAVEKNRDGEKERYRFNQHGETASPSAT